MHIKQIGYTSKNRHYFLIIVTSIFHFFSSYSIYGSTITVADNCSLALAIMAANADTQVGTCDAGFGDDIIVLTQDVELMSYNNNQNDEYNGLPIINSNIIINGNGFSVKRSNTENTPKFRIMKIVGDGIEVKLQNISIKNGYNAYKSHGAAIYVGSNATLIVENSSVVDNTDTYGQGGAITVEHSTLIVKNWLLAVSSG